MAVLVAARDEFNARGFAAARMDDIARRVGISKAALYLNFASKQAIFAAVVGDLIEQTLPEAIPAELADIPADLLLRNFIALAFTRLASAEMAFVPRVIIGEGMNFPELARFYHEEVVMRVFGILEQIIRHGISRGEMVCETPNLACRSIVGGILLGALWKIVFEPVGAEALDVSAMANAHADVLLNGLLVRKESAQ